MQIDFDLRFYRGDPEEFTGYCYSHWGKNSARKIERRLLEAHAANNLSVLLHGAPGRWHFLKGDRKWQISADLEHPLRLIFVIYDGHEPYLLEGNSINTVAIEHLVIIEITDTHQ